ncbi:MAG TPA: hypothetical protein VM141_03150, partial [Planctomycetota bacterium]|nr:hypothetical protein [Planctomycetota bacterium]
ARRLIVGETDLHFNGKRRAGPERVRKRFVGATQLAGPMPGKLVCMNAPYECIGIILHIPLLSKA